MDLVERVGEEAFGVPLQDLSAYEKEVVQNIINLCIDEAIKIVNEVCGEPDELTEGTLEGEIRDKLNQLRGKNE